MGTLKPPTYPDKHYPFLLKYLMCSTARVLSKDKKIVLVWGPAFSGDGAMQELGWKADEPRHEEVRVTETYNWETLPWGRRKLGLVASTPTSSSSDIYSPERAQSACNRITNLVAVETNAHYRPKLVFRMGTGKKNVCLLKKFSNCHCER